jgi:hypothetical protein
LSNGSVPPARRALSAPERSAGADDDFVRFRAAKQFMNTTAVDALGLKGYFFTMELEQASSLSDLRKLAGAFEAAIAKGMGEAQADVLGRRLRKMIA